MFVRGSIAILILFLFVTIVNGGTKFRSAQNLTVDEDLLNGDEDGESFRATDINDDINDTNDTYIDVDFDDHHHHENETVLSPTVLRWIPGGISVGIFVIFTIAATITTQMNQGNEKKEEGNMPDVADANFFEIDVVAKLKKKDNIFQRHLTQQKNRKFDLYNGMMRQYKDEIIAKRAQEQRHAELQKQKEMEKKRQEEKEKEKLGPLAKKILESSPRGTGSSSAPGISDSPNLRARAFTKTEDALLKPEGLAVPPPRSKSEGDAASIHRSKTEPSFRHNVFQEDEKDQGIMMKMKTQDDPSIPVINEETSFTSDGKQILKDLHCAKLISSVSVQQDDDDPEDKTAPTYLAPLKKTDTSTEKIPLEDFSSLPRRKKAKEGSYYGLMEYPEFQSFNVKEDAIAFRWNKWTYELEKHFKKQKVKDKKRKKALMLFYAGPGIHGIYRSLPGTDINEDYIDAKNRLGDYFRSQINETRKVYEFRCMKQKENEFINDFAKRLWKAAKECNFHDPHREVKDQIVLTCCSNLLRSTALVRNFRLNDLLKFARTLEKVENQRRKSKILRRKSDSALCRRRQDSVVKKELKLRRKLSLYVVWKYKQKLREKIDITPETEEESAALVEDNPDTEATPESKEETPEKKEEGFIPKWKKRMSRPFTWFYGGDDEYECHDDTEELVTKFKEENEERKKSRNEEQEKIDGLIDQFVQNAIASREVQTPGPSVTEDEPVMKRRTSSRRDTESRPFTWFSGFSPPDDYYFTDGSTDSITELIAQFMNLGPAPPPSKSKKRKQKPIKMTEEEEEKMLGEMEKRIIEGINEEQDKEPMPMSDVMALEKILDEYSNFVKAYSSDKDDGDKDDGDDVFE